VRSLTPFGWEMVASQLPEIISRALEEDIGDGDVTSNATIPEDERYRGEFLVKADGVIAGLEVVKRTFEQVDGSIEYRPLISDGAQVTPKTILAEAVGPARSLLTAERVALNFLQRMSGIATLTRQYIDAVEGTGAQILDTRKTVPGLRLLDKWAVAVAGGTNHRIGLYDMALIKDNHIVAAGGVTPAVERVRAFDKRHRPIEVEVTNLDQLHEALALNVDQIMLDNMPLEAMRAAVRLVDGAVPLEASGNVSLETVREIAETGVDYISVGKLTHSVPALDVSFDLNAA
jgi:nicotinate-nucleotide pyrophosphorylase (carboxylating)